jgi:energy-coupling factor transporter ATP-binding protein EcfA2
MKFRLAEIEVSDDDPFKHDSLQREEVVEFVSNLIKHLEGPFVLALDSPWGTGKTTVVNMLRVVLKKDSYTTVYFNAWKEDYVSDPLIPMVAAIDDIKIAQGGEGGVFRQRMAKVKKVVSTVAKRSLVAGVKVGTMGVLDLDKVQENVLSNEAGKATEDLIESFKKEKRSLEKFREALEEAVLAIDVCSEQRPLIFFIDELDRCRPSFAIELLERVKHLFDVKNIVFVLSIDKKQLEAITAAVYGERIDAQEYLRRFIDLDFYLPQPHTKSHTRELVKRFNLTQFFDGRRMKSSFAYDHDHFVDAFTLLAAAFDLSLRVRERCLTRLAVVLMQTPENHFLDPIVLALLIVLRLKRQDLYQGLISGAIAPQELMETLRRISAARGFFESRFANILEAYLVIGDVISSRSQKLLTEAEELSKLGTDSEQGQRALALLKMSKSVGGDWGRDFSIKYVADKVDLSARIGDAR